MRVSNHRPVGWEPILRDGHSHEFGGLLEEAESKRLGDAIQRRVAIDQIDALPGDADGAVDLHQAMPCGAGEQPLLLAPVFDHQEFRAHRGGAAFGILDA